jgi:hypothetical protein
MVKTSSVPTAITLGALLVPSATALANSVTDADLRGKTICWNFGGTRNTYGKDGSLDSNLLGHGTWSLSGDTLTEDGAHGVYTFTITKEGQNFHISGSTIAHANDISHSRTIFVDVFGSYCK